MSCCSPSSQPRFCPARYAVWLPRIAFGIVLLGFGVNHYRSLPAFVENAKGPFASVPALAAVAGALAYILPALMIVGGVLFAIKQLCPVSKVCILAALSGIIGWAGLGVLVATDPATLGNLGGAIQSASVLLILFYVIKKMAKCSKSSSSCCSASEPVSRCSGVSCQ